MHMRHRPNLLSGKDTAFYMPKKLVEKNDELAVTLRLICDRKLFGNAIEG